ncbi:MAG TPA: CBS domain-containing protein [Methanosarcinales archaeon]|nr:CBS domain-containing protein [Methanosarcinales archaeon]
MVVDYAKVSVAEIMTGDVVTVQEDATIDRVLELFSRYHYHSYPVVADTGELVGIISEDLVLAVLLFHRIPASSHTHLSVVRSLGDDARGIMMPYPVTVSPHTCLLETADLMLKHHVSRICVVEEGRLVGILSKRDIVNEICKRRDYS